MAVEVSDPASLEYLLGRSWWVKEEGRGVHLHLASKAALLYQVSAKRLRLTFCFGQHVSARSAKAATERGLGVSFPAAAAAAVDDNDDHIGLPVYHHNGDALAGLQAAGAVEERVRGFR